MTSQDVKEGVELTLRIAHDLHAKLGRYPRACEIRWRVASALRERWTTMDRRAAVRLADQMMDVVAAASADKTT